MECPKCKKNKVVRNGETMDGRQKLICKNPDCRLSYNVSIKSLAQEFRSERIDLITLLQGTDTDGNNNTSCDKIKSRSYIQEIQYKREVKFNEDSNLSVEINGESILDEVELVIIGALHETTIVCPFDKYKNETEHEERRRIEEIKKKRSYASEKQDTVDTEIKTPVKTDWLSKFEPSKEIEIEAGSSYCTIEADKTSKTIIDIPIDLTMFTTEDLKPRS